MLESGEKFPEFALPNQDGETVRLSDCAGKWLVVYVYPKDDTPGCTIQGQSFTSTKSDFDALGVTILGVSADDVASHRSFSDTFSFKVDLLADPDGTLLSGAGVGQSEFKGTQYWDRTTFVIGPDGVIRKVYSKVNPQGHELVLLEDIRQLQAA